MTILLAILGAIPAFYGLVVLFQKMFTPTQSQKSDAFLDRLNNAVKKASNEKDPIDLSDIVNKL